MKKLLLVDVINNELNMDLPYDREITISSPFRSDSNPSFRIYGTDENGNDRGAYDWGTGKSYNIISFIMELHGYSYGEALDYIADVYKINIGKSKKIERDNGLPSFIKTIHSKTKNKKSKKLTRAIELSIIAYLQGKPEIMHALLSKFPSNI